jgi:dTDP-4-dehydrorhamnose 3,5-epimerase
LLFRPLKVAGAYAVEVETLEDERGWFGRLFSIDEFARLGMDGRVDQCSLSFNRKASTLRGLHFQLAPDEESKLVLCISGAVYDVVVDLRSGSPTHKVWDSVELTSSEPLAVFVPPGVAHGYLTIVDNSTVYYQISTPYEPTSASGARWDDPAFGISWPSEPKVISARDSSFADYTG